MSDREVLRGLRDSVWLEQARYQQAETKYQELLAERHAGIHVQVSGCTFTSTACSPSRVLPFIPSSSLLLSSFFFLFPSSSLFLPPLSLSLFFFLSLPLSLPSLSLCRAMQ